jgi:hypothetical protein
VIEQRRGARRARRARIRCCNSPYTDRYLADPLSRIKPPGFNGPHVGYFAVARRARRDDESASERSARTLARMIGEGPEKVPFHSPHAPRRRVVRVVRVLLLFEPLTYLVGSLVYSLVRSRLCTRLALAPGKRNVFSLCRGKENATRAFRSPRGNLHNTRSGNRKIPANLYRVAFRRVAREGTPPRRKALVLLTSFASFGSARDVRFRSDTRKQAFIARMNLTSRAEIFFSKESSRTAPRPLARKQRGRSNERRAFSQ